MFLMFFIYFVISVSDSSVSAAAAACAHGESWRRTEQRPRSQQAQESQIRASALPSTACRLCVCVLSQSRPRTGQVKAEGRGSAG